MFPLRGTGQRSNLFESHGSNPWLALELNPLESLTHRGTLQAHSTSHLFSISYRPSGGLRRFLVIAEVLNQAIAFIFNNSSAFLLSRLFSMIHRLPTLCRFISPLFSITPRGRPSFSIFFGAGAPGVIFMDKLAIRPIGCRLNASSRVIRPAPQGCAASLSAIRVCLSLATGSSLLLLPAGWQLSCPRSARVHPNTAPPVYRLARLPPWVRRKSAEFLPLGGKMRRRGEYVRLKMQKP